MLWQLEHSEDLEQYRKYEKLTGEQADDVKNAPELYEWNHPVWSGFHSLSGSRQWTMGGAVSIPFSEMVAWLSEMRIADPDERNELMGMLQEMDRVYLGWVNRDED